MNIFITSFNSKEAASHLDDLRLSKMILETAQLLSSAYRYLFEDNEILYKSTHINHPCSIWARKSINNYSWLVEYFNDLSMEKFYRDSIRGSKKAIVHRSWIRLYELFFLKSANDYDEKISLNFFDFNCTEFKNEEDVRIAYRKQMIKKWKNDLKKPKWTGRGEPGFIYLISVL